MYITKILINLHIAYTMSNLYKATHFVVENNFLCITERSWKNQLKIYVLSGLKITVPTPKMESLTDFVWI